MLGVVLSSLDGVVMEKNSLERQCDEFHKQLLQRNFIKITRSTVCLFHHPPTVSFVGYTRNESVSQDIELLLCSTLVSELKSFKIPRMDLLLLPLKQHKFISIIIRLGFFSRQRQTSFPSKPCLVVNNDNTLS